MFFTDGIKTAEEKLTIGFYQHIKLFLMTDSMIRIMQLGSPPDSAYMKILANMAKEQ